jgi:hypothetical protein
MALPSAAVPLLFTASPCVIPNSADMLHKKNNKDFFIVIFLGDGLMHHWCTENEYAGSSVFAVRQTANLMLVIKPGFSTEKMLLYITTNITSHPLKTCFSSDKGINDLPGQ